MLDLGSGRQWLPFYEIVLGYRRITLNSKYEDSAELSGLLSVQGVGDTEVEVAIFDVELDRYPFADGSFDVVCCLELLEHLAVDPMHMMWEINRVLRPGGVLVLSTPNVVRYANLINMMLGEHPYGWSPYNGIDTNRHNREYTPREVSNLLCDAGFETSEVSTFGRKARGIKRDMLRRIASVILSPLRRCPAGLRNDFILAVAKKTTKPLIRRPSWLYYDMSDRLALTSPIQTQPQPVAV